jgi:hypothetical protein
MTDNDQHGLPRTLEQLLDDLIREAHADGAQGFEEPGDDVQDLRYEILQRWPLLPAGGR